MAKKREPSPAAALRLEMTQVGQALKEAYARFDYADDPDLIDACIYEINALKARYNYTLRRVKSLAGDDAPQAAPLQALPEPEAVAAANMEGGGLCRS